MKDRKLKQSGGNANESIKTSLQLAFGADHQREKKGERKMLKKLNKTHKNTHPKPKYPPLKRRRRRKQTSDPFEKSLRIDILESGKVC